MESRKMNLFAKEKQSHKCRKQAYSYQGEKRGWGAWVVDELGVGIDIYTLLYIK